MYASLLSWSADEICFSYPNFTLAVPQMVLVSADVYLTCKNMAILIPNPVIPVIVYKKDKQMLLPASPTRIQSCSSLTIKIQNPIS